MKISRLSFLSFFFSLAATAKLVERNVVYKDGDKNLEGYLVFDSEKAKNAPGILVVHDWMALSDRTKAKAQDLAKLGYVAFAADIYGQGIRPTDHKAASEQATIYKTNRKLFRERLNLALSELKKLNNVDKSKLAAIGFCFGGTGVLELARSGADVLGVVSFHGGLDSPDPTAAKNIKGKVLVLQGADDPYVQPKDWAAFEEELRKNKVDWQLVKFGGAVHSFTDKSAGNDVSTGAAYNEKADQRSWLMMKNFFAEIF